MSSILLEPIIPNLSKAGANGDQLRDLWRLFTKVKDCTQGGRRLENLYWRLWYQSSATGAQKEPEKISSLFETWRGDGVNFKQEKARSSTASPAAEISPSMNSVTATTTTTTTMTTTAAATTPVEATTTASFAPPPPTPSIQISRVSSNLKALAAAAAEPNAPAVPVNIMPKKKLLASKCANDTPSKLSVGFVCDQGKPLSAPAEVKPSASSTALASASASSSDAAPATTRGFQLPLASTVSAATTRSRTARSAAPRKKFFINSLSSSSSEESLDDLASEPEPPRPPASRSLFGKVTPSEPPHHDRLPPHPQTSNLSSLLKAPRRFNTRPVNILATAQHFTRRQAPDCAPQYIESESLRRGLQMERKPLVDPALACGGSSVATYAEPPAAW